MKSSSYLGSITLSKIDNDFAEKDLNKINQNDEILSVAEEPELKKEEKAEKGHITEKKIKELCNSVEKLTTSNNWEPVKTTFDNVKNEIEVLDPAKKYETLHIRFNEYYSIFERRYNNHLLVKKAINFKEQLCSQMEELTKSENLSEIKEKFNYIKNEWTKADKIPDIFEEAIAKKYKELVEKITKKIENVKEAVEENLSIERLLENCCEKAEKIINSDNIQKAAEKIKKIEAEWSELIHKATDIEAINKRFTSILDSFKEKAESISNELNKSKIEIQTKVSSLVSEIEECLSAENIKNVLQRVKDIQKECDIIEKSTDDKEEVKKLDKLIKKYFSKLKYLQQKEDWGRWENYTNKLLLCEKAEKLLDEQDLFKVSREIKTIWDDWRSIGQAPREKNDEIWERFNKTRQILKTKCNDFFKNLKEERGENTEKKLKLCEKAEELSSSINWEETAEELKNIQLEWKEVGPAEKKVDDELYNRFRNACNNFFENRIEFYKKLHQKQSVNKKEKKYLIDEAESLKDLNWKDAIKKIKKLRIEWKNTGTTNRQEEQRLWEKFNSTIEEYLSNLDASKSENLAKKENICNSISEFIANIESSNIDESEISTKLNELKAEWKNLGPVPKESEQEIESKYETLLDKITAAYQKILSVKSEKNVKNVFKKEEILVRIEELSSNGKFEENSQAFEQACNDWNTILVEISNETEEKLNKRYEEFCNAFKAKNKKFFEDIKENKKLNLKKKIKICIDLEKLADISTPADLLTGSSSGSLADELMFAIKGNFASSSGSSSDGENIKEKFAKLQKEWASTGVVPIEDYENINLRYNRACNSINTNLK